MDRTILFSIIHTTLYLTNEDITVLLLIKNQFISMKFILQTTRKIGFLAFILGVCLFSVQTAFSQTTTKTWAGASGADWSVAGNWTPSGIPAITDIVDIGAGANVIVSGTADCGKLSITSAGTLGKVTVNMGGTLNVTNAATTVNATIVLNGGTLVNNGTMTVTGRQNLDAIRFDNPTSGTFSSTYMGTGALTCNTVAIPTTTSGNSGTSMTFAQTSGGTATFTTSSSATYNFDVFIATPTTGTKSVFYCPKGTATIDGNATITIGGGRRSIRVIAAANSDAPNLTIGSGVTMELTTTLATVSIGMILLDPSTSLTGTSVSMTNKGTLNFSGDIGHPIYMTNSSTANTNNFTNEGTITINGTFTNATTSVTQGGIAMFGSNTNPGNVFTNSGFINFNTASGGTSTKPLLIASTSTKNSISNTGTITVGTFGTPAIAIRLGDSKTIMENTGTITLGAGSISGGTANAVFNNNPLGILNFNLAATNSLVAFTNAGGAFNVATSQTFGRLTANVGTVTVADGATLTTFFLTLTSGNITLGTTGTGNVAIQTGGSITGGSSTSYVVTNGTGALVIQGFTGSKTFPVGTTGAYAPVIVNNSASARNFSVKVGSTFSGMPVATNKMVQLEWDITPSVLTGNSADLTLQWPASVHGGSFNPALATEIAHYTGTWNEFKLATVSGSGPYTATATGFTSFSPFAVSNQNALSVELTNFKATPLSKINVLTWETASEINNKGFDVQRQSATGAWETLGFVNGTGKAATYTFEDKDPLSISYYRLRQIDFDGTETLSKIVSVSQNTKGLIRITPNPTSDKVNIQLNQNDVSNQTATVILFDMTGRQVLTQSTTAGAFQLDLSHLAKGMYVVTVQSNNAVYQEKIIRQ